MLLKSARFLLAALLALALCPAVALGDDGDGILNPNDEFGSALAGFADGNTANKTAGLYPNTLTPPPLTNTLPGFESAEELANGGILLGGGQGYLFYLREAAFKDASGVVTPAYRTLEAFNVNSPGAVWQTLASLPTYMEFVSACVWNEKIYLTGTPMADSGGLPAHASSPTAVIYTFDVSDEADLGGEWEQASGSNIPVATSLVNNGGRLEMVGGIRNGSPSSAIEAYDAYNGNLVSLDESLSSPAVGARTVTNDSTLYVYSYGSSLSDLQNGTGSPSFQTFSESGSSDASGMLPATVEPTNASEYPTPRAIMGATLATADSGIIMVGPTSGTTDTYRMKWGGDSFSPYSETASEFALSGGVCAVYLNNLYTVGSIVDASGVAKMIFRSTAMPNGTVLAGNNGVWRKGSTAGLEFRFSPNFGRFSNVAHVDDELIAFGADYEATYGSTIITLLPDYLEELAVGEYTLTTFYDNSLLPVTARFVIEEPANYMNDPSAQDGVNNPSALAATGDMMPVIPIVVLIVVAAIIAIIAFRRKTQS